MTLAKSCRLYGISRQAIYQRIQRHQQRQKALVPVKKWVLYWRRFMPRLGTRKLYELMKSQLIESGIKLGRDGLFDYLREEKLLIRPKRRYTKTTQSQHWMKKHPNLLKELTPQSPEEVFISDITYVESDEGVHYLSLVSDAYSRKIMGYCLSHDLATQHMVTALKRAIKQRQYSKAAIHHSDRGLQYCSRAYQRVLNKAGIRPSMTDGYDCYQNAMAERINGILKQEFLINRCKTYDELNTLIQQSVRIYNQMRPHLSLGMKTPEYVHQKARGGARAYT